MGFYPWHHRRHAAARPGVRRRRPGNSISGLAIFTAATCYAINYHPDQTAAAFQIRWSGACGVLIMASLLIAADLVAAGRPENNNGFSQPIRSLSVIWLGIGPTGIATIVLFAWSSIAPARPFLSTINYLIPVVAFFLRRLDPVRAGQLAPLSSRLATILGGIAHHAHIG